MVAAEIRRGDLIPGLGVVEKAEINYVDTVVRGPTPGMPVPWEDSPLVAARLAAEALEQTYQQVPHSVTYTSGTGRRSYLLDEEIPGVVRIPGARTFAAAA